MEKKEGRNVEVEGDLDGLLAQLDGGSWAKLGMEILEWNKVQRMDIGR
jgi:hypothetical protein